MISILLPTAARPEMLRTALQSIAGQTALGQVGRIFVSENGSDKRSGEVCASFPGLPITYLYRDPVSSMEHGRRLMRECLEGDYTDRHQGRDRLRGRGNIWGGGAGRSWP